MGRTSYVRSRPLPAGQWIATASTVRWTTSAERRRSRSYGALWVRDGQTLTQTAPARNTMGYLALLDARYHAYPTGDLVLIADNLASHSHGPMRDWLATHPRIQHAVIAVGAAWLNLVAGWWRIFRRKAFAGQSLANQEDSAYVTRLATAPLNRHAQPWVWGRPTQSTPPGSSVFRFYRL